MSAERLPLSPQPVDEASGGDLRTRNGSRPFASTWVPPPFEPDGTFEPELCVGEYEKSGRPLPPLAELVWGGPELPPPPAGQIDLTRALGLLVRFGFTLEAEVRVLVPGEPVPVAVGTLERSPRKLGRAVAQLVAKLRGVPSEKLPPDWYRGVILSVSQASTVSVTL